jgi:hypothetical protein
MARTETPVPGWYPDPDNADAIRYWDGSTWTDKRRPRPGWTSPAPALGTADAGGAPRTDSPMEPGARGGYLRTLPAGAPRPKALWVIGAILAAAAAVMALISFRFVTPRNPGPRTITDASFISAANQACKQMLTPLIHADRPVVGDSDKTVADRTEAAATGLDHLIATLRQLPVQPADQAHVDAWLAAWATYAATGHQVAAADRTSNASKYEPLLEQGRRQRFPVVDFAEANGIKSCTF